MISNHLSMVEAMRKNADSISARTAEFLANGGQIDQLKSPPRNPLPPPRSQKIDPGTVLKRKPKALSAADRKALLKMVGSL